MAQSGSATPFVEEEAEVMDLKQEEEIVEPQTPEVEEEEIEAPAEEAEIPDVQVEEEEELQVSFIYLKFVRMNNFYMVLIKNRLLD